MSDISPIQNNLIANNTPNITRPNEANIAPPVTSDPTSAERIQQKPQPSDEAANTVNDEFGPIIAMSNDGDTVRVKSSSIDDTQGREPVLYEAGKVNNYTPQSQPVQDFDIPEITSYASYTDSQLEQLYLQGKISQIDYNLEMESREAEAEARTSDENKFTADMTSNIAEANDMARTASTVNTLANGEVSDSIPIETRVQALQNLDNM